MRLTANTRFTRSARLLSLIPLALVACSAAAQDNATEGVPPGSSSSSNAGGGGNSGGGSNSGGTSATSDDAGSSGTGSSAPPESGSGSGDASTAPPVTPPAKDASAPPSQPDAGGSTPTPTPDAGSSSPPARNSTCTPLSQETGTAVNTTHGRLDGTLVYVLPVNGSSSCNGDDAHVHLQIEVSGNVYDVAVDIGKSGDEVGWFQQTMAMPGGAWSEGWHGSDSLGYSSLGLSSSQFATLSPTAMASEVESLLVNTSKISIFCTGYTPEDDGCHDVHYQDGSSQDGAIVLDPTAATSPVVFFRFTDETF